MTRGRFGGVLAAMVLAGLVSAGCSSGGVNTAPASGGAIDPRATTTSTGRGTAALLEAVCAGTATVADAGTVSSKDLTEVSGIAASHRNPGVWWVHNDSGDSARFFALSDSGQLLATFDVDGATATDWEDIAVGPPATGTGDEGGATIYLADIGDNGRTRPSVTVYRVPEPGVDPSASGATRHVTADALTLTYPDGPHDAEALMVDPESGDLVIVTKDWTMAGHSQVFRAPGGSAAGSSTVLESEGTLDLRVATLVTGADVSPDGTVVALRAYGGVDLYPRPAGQPLWSAFAQTSCGGPPPLEKQGEAIGFAADGGSYATIGEGESATLHVTQP